MSALGETVAVLSRSQSGTDAMGEPVWEWTATEVQGCLVRPLSGSDITDSTRPDGVRVSYTIAFPKTYDGPSLEHARVALVDRGMDATDAGAALRVSGAPDVTRPCPTMWDMTASVGRVDG